ncbi:MAG: dienelactone hydrolase family protein [candidate division KSB1 bacterium]|nr:dienelactone hydrolase family protein [candidate division KSB1 bacterium]MDZ7276186.1 dienelactone hydrolase family protein [candidate division KSB1 bacterium]MDZ7287034.1 dienelactone hydrolase family protein [candidate division KSB1 bacterium]MDZ7297041.1 dienelactone hydrolase family protein [candidate division KSB1 bacterium]MDZ7307198.1 dienelactone hydrolase family protein [candidate division KSB1 bacterium]
MKLVRPAILLGLAAVVAASAEVRHQEVTYAAGGVTMKGYLAYDDAVKGRCPGVLVVHEWWGHNDYARKRADMLAQLGYTALAVDMYGDGRRAEHPEEAGKFASAVMQNLPAARARFEAALALLKRHRTTDSTRIAAIGYCFGGGVVLHMARLGVDLKGVVSFHGSYATQTPAQPGRVKAAVLVCHGEADQFITAEQIAALKKEMADAGVDFQFISYPDARHSFTSPAADSLGRKFNLPLGYNRAADEKSWADMQQFFKKIFKQ